MTTLLRASLFLDSVACPSDWRDSVATCDRLERLLGASKKPFRLDGLMSDEILGERESGREEDRCSVLLADEGLQSVKGDVLVSLESDLG